MPAGLPKRKAAALAELGLRAESYYVDGWPPIWGLSLVWVASGVEAAVIENTTSASSLIENGTWDGERGKPYVVRRARSIEDARSRRPLMGPAVRCFRLQRLAIGWVVEDLFINAGRTLDRAVLRRVV